MKERVASYQPNLRKNPGKKCEKNQLKA